MYPGCSLILACSLCNMPSTWHGLWYQRGMNSLLEITIDHFQTKGHCQDVLPSEQYYLFHDRYVNEQVVLHVLNITLTYRSEKKIN